MARKAQETGSEIVKEVPIDGELVKVSTNAMAEHSTAIAELYGDGVPYDRNRVVGEARFYMSQSAEAMLEAGKRLIVLKENEPHGDFTEIVTQQLGLPERSARRMMEAAIKFMPASPNSKRPALAVLGKTKLFELMTEDSEQLDALADGGTVAGLTLDDIERMTSRELKAALREARETADAKDRVLADKSTRIDKLAEDLIKSKQRVADTPADEAGQQIRSETGMAAFAAEAAILGKLRAALGTLISHGHSTGMDHSDFMAGLVGQIELALNQVRGEFDIKDAPTGDDIPEFIRQMSSEDKAQFNVKV